MERKTCWKKCKTNFYTLFTCRWGSLYRDFPILAYDGRPSIYHGVGSKAGREWANANEKIQDVESYWKYGNSALTDPITGKPCGKGYEKYE